MYCTESIFSLTTWALEWFLSLLMVSREDKCHNTRHRESWLWSSPEIILGNVVVCGHYILPSGYLLTNYRLERHSYAGDSLTYHLIILNKRTLGSNSIRWNICHTFTDVWKWVLVQCCGLWTYTWLSLKKKYLYLFIGKSNIYTCRFYILLKAIQ